MIDYALTPQQLAVICALSSGATMTHAAQEAGVHRNTLANWRRNQIPFQYAFAHAQYDRALFYREQAEAQVDQAFQTINHLLADPKTPASVRLKAALALIQLATTPPAPKKEFLLDIEKITCQKVQPAPVPEPIAAQQPEPVPEPTPAPEPEILHNPAQSTHAQPISRPTPSVSKLAHKLHNPAQPPMHSNVKVGRNEPCPCGSGQKYKRCCLNKTVRTEFVQRLACHPGV
jgi:hypothetical protein